MVSGIAQTDFGSIPISDVGRSVDVYPVTRDHDHYSGDEELTWSGTATAITAYFVRKFENWTFDKEGLVEGGDAYMGVQYGDTVSKDDKVVINSETFIVKNIIPRYAGSTLMYHACNLFLWTGAGA